MTVPLNKEGKAVCDKSPTILFYFSQLVARFACPCVWLCPHWRASLGVSLANLNKGHCGGGCAPSFDPPGSQEACMMEIAREIEIIE